MKNASYNYGYFQPYYMPAGEQETRSVYLQDAVSFGSLTVTPGVRYDHVTNTGQPNRAPRYNDSDPSAGHDYSSVTYTGWSPHLGVMWKATSNLSLFADVSRTWRAPVIDEQYEVQSAASSVPGTSRGLQVERMTGVRLGAVLDFNDVLMARDSLQIRTTLFRNRGKDEFSIVVACCATPHGTGANVGNRCRTIATCRAIPLRAWSSNRFMTAKACSAACRSPRSAANATLHRAIRGATKPGLPKFHPLRHTRCWA